MEKYIIRVNGAEYEVEVEKKTAGAEHKGKEITAGTAGKVWKVTAPEGTSVKSGDSIVILEAMKMEIPVIASCDGKIEKLFVSEGEPVEAGQKIATVI